MGLLKKMIFLNGLVFTLMLILSFTDLPYLMYHHLGTALIQEQKKAPTYIILMGAGGMPGPQGLLRSAYTAALAKKFPESQIVVTLPADLTEKEETDHTRTIDELVLKGVEPNRIQSEYKGTNTRSQALNIKEIIKNIDSEIVIVTSPEHMYRSILTFKKVGFTHVNGMPAFESAFDENLLLAPEDSQKEGSKPSTQNLDLRYNMWSYLQYQIIVAREYAAITYYKVMGYI